MAWRVETGIFDCPALIVRTGTPVEEDDAVGTATGLVAEPAF